MIRVAVTGGTGFIGGHLLAALLERGATVRALTRGAKPIEDDRLAWVPGSLESPSTIESLVTEATHVIHLAANVRGNSREVFLRTNTHASESLFQCCADLPAPPRILFVSSLAAREPHLSYYARSKHLAERCLAERFPQLDWTIFRPPAVYGPGDTEVRPLLRLASLGFLPAPGNPRHRLSLLHVHDLVEAMLAWMDSGQASGKILELGDPALDGYDWSELAQIMGEFHGRSVRVVRLPGSLLRMAGAVSLGLGRTVRRPVMLSPGKVRELLHPDWTVDARHARACLAWTPRIGLLEGLRTPS